jgi:hypothetical protein
MGKSSKVNGRKRGSEIESHPELVSKAVKKLKELKEKEAETPTEIIRVDSKTVIIRKK